MAAAATRVHVRVSPRARRSGVVGRHGEAWKVRVAAPPIEGRANAATLALLAEALEVPLRALTLLSGESSRDKVFEVEGLGRNDVDGRLARWAAAGGV
jgi:uncharacterized protein (TIGR00251 family)